MNDENAVNHMKARNGIPDKGVTEFHVESLAAELGVAVRTIKNWEKKGWIPMPRRNNFNWRVYTQAEIDAIVKTVEKNGFFTNIHTTFASSKS